MEGAESQLSMLCYVPELNGYAEDYMQFSKLTIPDKIQAQR